MLFEESSWKAHQVVYPTGYHFWKSVLNTKTDEAPETYFNLKLFRLSSSLHIRTISSQSSKRFLLRSSSTIFGQTCLIVFVDVSALATLKASTRTIFSSCSWASTALILSKPTSWTSFPEISISFSSTNASRLSVVSVAYFECTASTKDWKGSDVLEGRIKDPGVWLLLLPGI